MIIASGTQFHVYLPLGQRPFSSVFIVGVGAFSMIVQNNCETDESSVALFKTSWSTLARPVEQQIVNLSILFQIIFEGGSKYL